MKFVKAQVISNQLENDNAGRDSDAESKDVDQRIGAIPQEISKRGNKVVLNHIQLRWRLLPKNPAI